MSQQFTQRFKTGGENEMIEKEKKLKGICKKRGYHLFKIGKHPKCKDCGYVLKRPND